MDLSQKNTLVLTRLRLRVNKIVGVATFTTTALRSSDSSSAD